MAFDSEASVRFAWTENKVHELRSLIEASLSSREIADRLGTTDKAVRNKAWRLGEGMGLSKGRPCLSDDLKEAREARDLAQPKPRIVVKHWPPIPMPGDLRSVDTPEADRVTFMDLTDGASCRWPIGPTLEPGSVRTLFCGCETYGETYCPEHEELARKSDRRLAARR